MQSFFIALGAIIQKGDGPLFIGSVSLIQFVHT